MILRKLLFGALRFVPVVMLLAAALLLVAPQVARADAPDTRGDDEQPHGAVGSTTSWEHVTPLAPLDAVGGPQDATATAWNGQAGALAPQPAWNALAPNTQTSALPWLGRALNPGNWILDAGLGIVAAMFNMLNEWLLAWLRVFIPQLSTPDAVPALTCDGSAALAYMLCTDPSLLFGAEGGSTSNPVGTVVADRLSTLWKGLRPAATGLVTILFVVKLGRLIAEGQRSLTTEGRSIVTAFIVAIITIQATGVPLRYLFVFFYSLNNAILAGIDGTISQRIFVPILSGPVLGGASVQLAQILGMFIVLIPLTLMVTIALIRLVKMALLCAVAPLAAATLFDQSTAPFFRRWLERLVDLLLQQTMWAIAFGLGLVLIDALPSLDLSVPETDPALAMVVQSLYAVLLLVLVLMSRQLFDNLLATGASGHAVSMLTRRGLLTAAATAGWDLRRQRPGGPSPTMPPAGARAAPATGASTRRAAAPQAPLPPPVPQAPAATQPPGTRAAAAVRYPAPHPATVQTQRLTQQLPNTGPTRQLSPVQPAPASPSPQSTGSSAAPPPVRSVPQPQRPSSVRRWLRPGRGGSGSRGGTPPTQP